VRTSKGESIVLKISRISRELVYIYIYIYIDTLAWHINFRGEKKGENWTL
jgi:hypothetical protein